MAVFYYNKGIYVRYLIFRLELTYIAICTYLIVANIKYELKAIIRFMKQCKYLVFMHLTK